MAARATGFAMLASNSVQEVMDIALIAQAATLESRVPFLHFFDGFRTSHEVAKIEQLTDDDMRAMIDDELVHAHRARALSPDRPVLRGTRAEPRRLLPGARDRQPVLPGLPRPSCRTRWTSSPSSSGRQYHLFDYVGAPDAERVIIMMGSGAEAAAGDRGVPERRAARRSACSRSACTGRSPSSTSSPRCPRRVKRIAVLDRTKEPGATGEPLYLDVVTALSEALAAGKRPFNAMPRVIGGRYGLSSKEFTPAMVKAVFDELRKAQPKNHFTVGINDDVTHTSLDYDPEFSTEDPSTRARAVLRPGRRRHGGRQQELHQDHRRGHRQLRPGLLRLRLEEVRRDHHLAPALRAASRSARPT